MVEKEGTPYTHHANTHPSILIEDSRLPLVKCPRILGVYLDPSLSFNNVCHPITTRATPESQMKETLYTRHRNTVEPMMVKNDRKASLQSLHTDVVDCCCCCCLPRPGPSSSQPRFPLSRYLSAGIMSQRCGARLTRLHKKTRST